MGHALYPLSYCGAPSLPDLLKRIYISVTKTSLRRTPRGENSVFTEDYFADLIFYITNNEIKQAVCVLFLTHLVDILTIKELINYILSRE